MNDVGNGVSSFHYLKENRTWFLVLGISLVILGTLAVIFSFTSTIFSVVYLGVLMLVFGLFEGIKSFKLRWSNNFLVHFLLSILYIVSGAFIVAQPLANAITLTLLLAIFFIVTGILKIIFAIAKQLPHQVWLMLSGIFNIILGMLIWHQWPFSGLWILGTFVGIDAIVTGWSWIMLWFALKRIEQ